MKKEKVKLLDNMKDIIARNPFAEYIGMELLEVTEGNARARIRLEPQYENVYGGMHGGCAYSLADTVAGIAAASYGIPVTTLNASVNYMLPVTNTEYLYAEAVVQRRGGKISVVRVELRNDADRLLIDAGFTYYHLSAK